MLVADLDLGDIARGKFDFDVIGHYARPDVFQMRVNEEVMTGVAECESSLPPVAGSVPTAALTDGERRTLTFSRFSMGEKLRTRRPAHRFIFPILTTCHDR